MDGKNNGVLIFLGLILAVACFAVGRSTTSTPDNITVNHNHRFAFGTIFHDDKNYHGFTIRLVKP